ncbi:mechanosensitive ion channel [Candidatus Halobeggiatoa sp. HSG11]|nr:mechanosensitive ion channel [Candidatus Halobeggiatoa sp. HSG11]
MSLFKQTIFCIFLCLSVIYLPVQAENPASKSNSKQTTGQAEQSIIIILQQIEEQKEQNAKLQVELKKAQVAVQAEEQALQEKITGLEKMDQITEKILKAAGKARQTANQQMDKLRLKRETVQAELDKLNEHLITLKKTLENLTEFPKENQTVAQNQKISKAEQKVILQKQGIILKQQSFDIFKKQTEIAVNRTIFAIDWHNQLQNLPQKRRIQERTKLIKDTQVNLEHENEALKAEQKELPNQAVNLEAMQLSVEKLTEMFEKTTLDKDATDIEVKNLILERQNAAINIEKQEKAIVERLEKLEKFRKMPPIEPEQAKLQKRKVLELEASIKLQQQTLKLDQQQLDFLRKRIEQAEKKLELAIEWHEKVQAIYKVRQTQELEVQIQKKRQHHLANAAELRWQLEKIPNTKEYAAQRYLLKIQIQEANELATQVARKLKVKLFQKQIQQGHTTVEQQTTEVFSQTQLDSIQLLTQETNILLQDVIILQELLQDKISVLKQQQKVTKKFGSSLKGKALKQNKAAQKLLTKLQKSLQQEQNEIPTLLANTEELSNELEKVYKTALHRSTFRQRQLPTDVVGWQSLAKEISTIPNVFLQQFQMAGKGFMQAFHQVEMQHWVVIGIVILIWLFAITGMRTWFIRAMSKLSQNVDDKQMSLGVQLIDKNIAGIAFIGVVVLLLWLIQPTQLTIFITMTILVIWLGTKLLINLSRLLTSRFQPPRIKLHCQLRWMIITIAILTIVTVLVHVKLEEYVLKLSLTTLDLIDTVFMVVLALLVMPLMRIRKLMMASLERNIQGYWLLVISIISILLPLAILTVAVLGLIGYITLGWTIAKYLSLFLLVLTGWLILKEFLTNTISLVGNSVAEQSRYSSLWTEDLIPLIAKLLGFALFVLAIGIFFWLTGWLDDVAVRDNIVSLLTFSLLDLGDGNHVTLGSILLAFFIIWLVFWFGGWSQGVTYRWVYLKIKDAGLRKSLSVFTQYVVVIVGLLIAMKVIGIDPTALTVFAGAVGVGIGFGLQNIINNFVSGLLLLVSAPFQVEDRIKVGSSSDLLVKEITWLNTRFQDDAGVSVAIPNSSVLGTNVRNYNSSKGGHIWFWPSLFVDPRHNPEKVLQIIKEAMEAVDVVIYPWPYFYGINDWAAEYWICYAIDDYEKRWDAIQPVWIEVWKRLNEAGIEPAVRRQEIYNYDGDKVREIPSGSAPPMLVSGKGTSHG